MPEDSGSFGRHEWYACSESKKWMNLKNWKKKLKLKYIANWCLECIANKIRTYNVVTKQYRIIQYIAGH